MHPFTTSISLFARPGILYSLWTADMQTKSQQPMPFGATWSNPIIWGRSRATSVPGWCEEKEEERMGQLSPKGPCGWEGLSQGERGGDTPKMGFLIPLGSPSSGLSVKSLFPAWTAGWVLSWSSCYWKEGGCSAFGSPLYTHMHREVHGCDSTAKKGRINRSDPTDLKSIPNALTFSKGNIWVQTIAWVELTTSFSPSAPKGTSHEAKTSVEPFLGSFATFLWASQSG